MKTILVKSRSLPSLWLYQHSMVSTHIVMTSVLAFDDINTHFWWRRYPSCDDDIPILWWRHKILWWRRYPPCDDDTATSWANPSYVTCVHTKCSRWNNTFRLSATQLKALILLEYLFACPAGSWACINTFINDSDCAKTELQLAIYCIRSIPN